MSPAQEAALTVLALVGWIGLVLCVLAAIVLTLLKHPDQPPVDDAAAAEPESVVPPASPVGSRLDMRL